MNFLLAGSRSVLGAIFFLSGMAALLYQVSWQRLLTVYYGVGPISTAIVVSIFMLGLGIGGLLGGRISVKTATPVQTYMLIEAGVAGFGLLSLSLLRVIGVITTGSDYSLMLLYVSGYLLIPTVLMGMTLPITVRILNDIGHNGLENISFFYFINTLGAAFGAVVGSYILISFYGIGGAVNAAVLTNILLAVAIYLVAKHADKSSSTHPPNASVGEGVSYLPFIFTALFVNGFIAIGYQIVWYRVAGVLLKDSAYSFSTILAIYLLGIGLGSYWLNRRAGDRNNKSGFDFYLKLNVMVAFAAAIPILVLYHFAEVWPLSKLIQYGLHFQVLPAVHKVNDLTDFLQTMLLVGFWPFFLIITATFFMGAAFPVGISLLGVNRSDSGFTVGIGYAVTIAGNTLGGLVCAFYLLPRYGSMGVLSGFCLIQTCYVIIIMVRSYRDKHELLRGIGVLACGVFFVLSLPRSANLYKKIHPQYPGYQMYFKEGVEGVVMAYEKGDVVWNYINGSAHAGRPGFFFVNESLVTLGHSDRPKNVLVIGYGTGALTDGLLLDDRIEQITLVELNKTVIENLSNIKPIKLALENKKVHVVYDDGRRFLGRSQERFDVVLMDPLRCRSAFSNNIYSRDFFSLVRSRLSNNGVFMVWTDDITLRIDKGLAETFDFVIRYPSFLIASKKYSSFSPITYAKLVTLLPKPFADKVKSFYVPPIRDKEAILQVANGYGFEAPTDLSPNLEYYLRDMFVK